MVARLVAYESWDDTSETEAPRSSVSAIGLIAVLSPMPVCAIASASMRSFFAVPGNISRAFFIAFPGRYPTSTPFARHLRTTSEPMLFFWSTMTRAPSPASSSSASTSSWRLSSLRLILMEPSGSSPTAQWNDFPTSIPR